MSSPIKLERLVELVALRLQQQHPLVVPEYLTPEQASRLTGFSVKALERRRERGQPPEYVRVGRSVRYRVDDLRKWLGDAPP